MKVSFRYVRLTENQKDEIVKEFQGTITNVESNLSKTNGYVVFLDLDEFPDPATIKKLNDRLNIDDKKCGVWVTLTTPFDHSGLCFPDYVIDLIRIVGEQIDISTMMIMDDEEKGR